MPHPWLTAAALTGAAALARILTAKSRREHRELDERLRQLDETLQKTIAELTNDKLELSTVLDNMVEGVAAVDHEGRLFKMNPAMTALLGVGDAAWAGKPFLEIVRNRQLNALLEGALAGKSETVDEVILPVPEERRFEARAAPLKLLGGRAGALLVLHEITRLRKLEQVRKDFVANVSHELRTPLASIKAFAETLRAGGLDDKENRLQFVQCIENDADHMARLVEDLLELSTIESGKRAVALTPVKAADCVNEVIKALKPLARRAKVTLISDSMEHLPQIASNPEQLRQMLTNVIDNAIKFNKQDGKVTVSGEVRGASVAISVADSGIGIPSQDIPRIFERFYRVDRARTRDASGTGLGLAIVKHLAEAQGGSVAAESSEGRGTTITITLPRAA